MNREMFKVEKEIDQCVDVVLDKLAKKRNSNNDLPNEKEIMYSAFALLYELIAESEPKNEETFMTIGSFQDLILQMIMLLAKPNVLERLPKRIQGTASESLYKLHIFFKMMDREEYFLDHAFALYAIRKDYGMTLPQLKMQNNEISKQQCESLVDDLLASKGINIEF